MEQEKLSLENRIGKYVTIFLFGSILALIPISLTRIWYAGVKQERKGTPIYMVSEGKKTLESIQKFYAIPHKEKSIEVIIREPGGRIEYHDEDGNGTLDKLIVLNKCTGSRIYSPSAYTEVIDKQVLEKFQEKYFSFYKAGRTEIEKEGFKMESAIFGDDEISNIKGLWKQQEREAKLK